VNPRELPPPAAPPEVDPSAPVPESGIAPAAIPRQPAANAHARATYLPSRKRRGVALCLSGGGFRAALFHLGSVRRLNELGVLGRVDTITSVSGGSFLAAHLAAVIGPSWPAAGESFADFDAKVAAPFHAFCARNIRTWPLLLGLLPWTWGGHAAVDELERQVFGKLTRLPLSGVPERPRFVFCATDMSYGVNWTFTRDQVGSYMAGYASTPSGWNVARAVAASACFPPFFNPQPIGLKPGELMPGRDRSAERDRRIRGLRLSDGGL
jgi:NTE family protein